LSCRNRSWLEQTVSNSIAEGEEFEAPNLARLQRLSQKALQALCVQHGLAASGTQQELATQLSKLPAAPRVVTTPAATDVDGDADDSLLQHAQMQLQLLHMEQQETAAEAQFAGSEAILWSVNDAAPAAECDHQLLSESVQQQLQQHQQEQLLAQQLWHSSQ
jgi:hypothetical protein